MVLVRWLGYDSKYNSWIPQSDIQNLGWFWNGRYVLKMVKNDWRIKRYVKMIDEWSSSPILRKMISDDHWATKTQMVNQGASSTYMCDLSRSHYIPVLIMLDIWEVGNILRCFYLKIFPTSHISNIQTSSIIINIWWLLLRSQIYVEIAPWLTIWVLVAQWLERLMGHQKIAGLIPVWGSEIIFLSIGLDDHLSFILKRNSTPETTWL